MGDPAPAPPPVTEKTIQLPHDAVDLVEDCFHTSATVVYWIECPPSDPEVSRLRLPQLPFFAFLLPLCLPRLHPTPGKFPNRSQFMSLPSLILPPPHLALSPCAVHPPLT
jgi:hypothetical protein